MKSHLSVLTQARSRPRHTVDCLADDTLASPDQTMQLSGADEM